MTSHNDSPAELRHYDDTELRRTGPRPATRIIAFIVAAMMVLAAISVAVGMAFTSRNDDDRPTIDAATGMAYYLDDVLR